MFKLFKSRKQTKSNNSARKSQSSSGFQNVSVIYFNYLKLKKIAIQY